MFHTYVRASSGTDVDFDRASFLMDWDVLHDVLDAMGVEQKSKPRWTTDDRAQWVWDDYCARHLAQYGEPFGPNVIAGWDQPTTPIEPLRRTASKP
jgi:hypothetical protein